MERRRYHGSSTHSMLKSPVVNCLSLSFMYASFRVTLQFSLLMGLRGFTSARFLCCFSGSLNCLDVLLFVRHPVYQPAWALYHTRDMNTHSSSSVITFYCSNSDSSHTPFLTPFSNSLTSRAFQTDVSIPVTGKTGSGCFNIMKQHVYY